MIAGEGTKACLGLPTAGGTVTGTLTGPPDAVAKTLPDEVVVEDAETGRGALGLLATRGTDRRVLAAVGAERDKGRISRAPGGWRGKGARPHL